MEYKHEVQGPDEFLIKLGTETKKELQTDFNAVYTKYMKRLKEKGCEELIFKTEKNTVLIYGIRKIA